MGCGWLGDAAHPPRTGRVYPRNANPEVKRQPCPSSCTPWCYVFHPSGAASSSQPGRALILICALTGFPSRILRAAQGSDCFWWFQEKCRRSSRPSRVPGMGFLRVSLLSGVSLLPTVHLFYRTAELPPAATPAQP